MLSNPRSVPGEEVQNTHAYVHKEGEESRDPAKKGPITQGFGVNWGVLKPLLMSAVIQDTAATIHMPGNTENLPTIRLRKCGIGV